MNRSVTYRHKDKVFKVNISTPMTDKIAIAVEGVLCHYVTPEKFLEQMDALIIKSIERYCAEKNIGLI